MSRITETNLRTKVLSTNVTKEEVENFLKTMTDSDFNGKNGESYYTEVDGEKMSRLNECMLNFEAGCDDCELVEFIEEALKDNYSDDYYVDAKIDVFQVENSIVACVSYIS